MKARARALTVLLTASALAAACQQQTGGGEKGKQTGEAANRSRPKEVREADELPSFDRTEFKASAQSIARADLLACRNTDARFTRGGQASIGEFAKNLHGTWIGRRRTVHGEPVATDQIFLIDLRGAQGTGVLIDRSNLPEQFVQNYEGMPAKEVYSFVDCTYQFIDRYEKVSDDVDIAVLGKGTGVDMNGVRNLREAWERLVKAGYFNGFRMPVDARGATRAITNTQLGDSTRMAILPTGRTVSEPQIEQGEAPGAEYKLPMLVGGLFDMKLSLRPARSGRFNGVYMRWDAVYRGAGINIPPGGEIRGVEQGMFIKEGGAYVSAVSEMDASVWSTSECGDKNGLNALVMDDEVQQRLNDDPAHRGHAHEGFKFTRVVLGAP